MAKKVFTFGGVMLRLSPPGYKKFSQATPLENILSLMEGDTSGTINS